MKIKRQGIDTFSLEISVLSRDRTQEKAPGSFSFFKIDFYRIAFTYGKQTVHRHMRAHVIVLTVIEHMICNLPVAVICKSVYNVI